MSMQAIRIPLMMLAGVLAGCAPRVSHLFDRIDNLDASGKVSRTGDLTAFQRLVKARVMREPDIDEIFAMEVDVPLGEGTEGAYMELRRKGKSAEVRYIEQKEHLPR